MSFESISTEAMDHVVGGSETACRVVGGAVGGTLGAIANTVPNPLMSAAGALNTVTSAAKGDPTFAIDALAAGGSMVPGVSAAAGAWTGAKIGSRAGAALCGYRP